MPKTAYCGGCGDSFKGEDGVRAHQRHHATDCSTDDQVLDEDPEGDAPDPDPVQDEGEDQADTPDTPEPEEADTPREGYTDPADIDTPVKPSKDADGPMLGDTNLPEEYDPTTTPGVTEGEDTTETPLEAEETGKTPDTAEPQPGQRARIDHRAATELQRIIHKGFKLVAGRFLGLEVRDFTDDELDEAGSVMQDALEFFIPAQHADTVNTGGNAAGVVGVHLDTIEGRTQPEHTPEEGDSIAPDQTADSTEGGDEPDLPTEQVEEEFDNDLSDGGRLL